MHTHVKGCHAPIRKASAALLSLRHTGTGARTKTPDARKRYSGGIAVRHSAVSPALARSVPPPPSCPSQHGARCDT